MAYGDGSLFKNDRGTWTGFRTIDGKRYKRTAPTKTEVRAKLSKLAKDIATGEHEARSKRSTKTVEALVEEWLVDDMPAGTGEKMLAPATQDRHHQSARHVTRLLGSKRIAELTVTEVRAAFKTLADEGQSRASIVKVCNTLSLALQSAEARDEIDRNVAGKHKLVIPTSAARTVPRKSLTPDEARTLLGALRDEPNGLAFALSLRLGLRPGETWAIYWEDVGDDTVNITRGIQRSGGRSTISDELKTSSSKRTIALPTDLIDWFGRHRAAQATERLAARSWHDDRLVFAGPTGRIIDPSRSRKMLTAICERLEAERAENDLDADAFPTLRPNELRHSCASLLSDEGVPNELVADLLGHTTTRMVDQTYRHRLRPVVDVAAMATWADPS
jgi:integrase